MISSAGQGPWRRRGSLFSAPSAAEERYAASNVLEDGPSGQVASIAEYLTFPHFESLKRRLRGRSVKSTKEIVVVGMAA